MISDIFNDIWKWLNDFSGNIYDFIMENYNNPFLWIILLALLLFICLMAISNLASK